MTAPVDDPQRTAAADGPVGPEPRRRGLSKGRVVVLLVALGALVVVFALTRRGDAPAVAPPASDATAEGELPIDPLTGLPVGYRTYQDEEAGFKLAHPETWVPIARPDENRRLLLSAGGDNSLSVRYNLNDEPFDPETDLEAMVTTTQRIVASGGAQVLKRQGFNLNGIDGITYLSRFTNPETGRSHVNAHYFLFQGRKMFVVLFQAAPDPPLEPDVQFERMLPDINAILDSFTIEPEEPQAPAGGG